MFFFFEFGWIGGLSGCSGGGYQAPRRQPKPPNVSCLITCEKRAPPMRMNDCTYKRGPWLLGSRAYAGALKHHWFPFKQTDEWLPRRKSQELHDSVRFQPVPTYAREPSNRGPRLRAVTHTYRKSTLFARYQTRRVGGVGLPSEGLIPSA